MQTLESTYFIWGLVKKTTYPTSWKVMSLTTSWWRHGWVMTSYVNFVTIASRQKEIMTSQNRWARPFIKPPGSSMSTPYTPHLHPMCKNKKGKISDAGNYRPVSLATIISKSFEHRILSCISPLLATTLNSQPACRGGRSHFFRLRLRTCSKISESASGYSSNLRIRLQ